MDVTAHMRQLETVGFTGEILDRAIAAAGASRLAYQALIQAVSNQGMSPAEALHTLEGTPPPANA